MKRKIAILIVLFLTTYAYSQGPPPPPPPGLPTIALPIDSQIILLCIAGIALGVKKILKN
jgi:hypothetical protein